MVKRFLLAISLFTLFAISMAACSNESTPPSDLLLDSNDFPEMNITEISRGVGSTDSERPAVQVELRANGFTILESLVVFENKDLALSILTSIKQDQTGQGVGSVPVEGFDDNSGVMVEHLDDDEKSTVFFVEGRVLVRITVSGEEAIESIWEIASRAREKSEG